MRCPRCGTWLRAGASRCGPCGADFGERTKQPKSALDGIAHDGAPPWVSGWVDDSAARRRAVRVRRALVSIGAVGLVMLGAAGATWIDDEPSRRPVAAAERSYASAGDVVRAGDFSDVYRTVNGGVGQVLVETCDDGDYTGSGFLIRPRLMVTAHHVIEGASTVRVDFGGGPLGAQIHGVDAARDLAVLRLDWPVGRHVFDFAPDEAVPGTRVAAIGYPLNEPKTLTEGTISGLDRVIDTDSGSFAGMVQTDTAINPGNSGGPLVDLNGNVVGVADAIRKNAQGIGFAVPASAAADLLTRPLGAQELETCS
jgi:S1-C subfamily serine protease